MTEGTFRLTAEPRLEKPSLIVGWTQDAGRLGAGVINYLNAKIKGESFCQIEAAEFFALNSIAVENDVAQFPASTFYHGTPNNLALFKADEPQLQKNHFLNAILDVAEHYCKVEQIYTVNGIVSSIAHTSPRRILAVFNQPQIQKQLRSYNLENMTWQGRPHLSTYLLWLAKNRDIPAAGLWVEVPFYLATCRDFQSLKTVADFFVRKITPDLSIEDLDEKIDRQNLMLSQLRRENSEVDRSIAELESGLSLNEEQQMQLIKITNDLLQDNV